MLILKTIICGRHLEENYRVTAWCTLRHLKAGPFCVCVAVFYLLWEPDGRSVIECRGGKGRKQSQESKEEEPSRDVCVPCLLACLQAGKKKMKFSTVLFLWQIQLLWGLVQSGVTSKRQKLKTWQLMKWQMTRKFRRGRQSDQTPGGKRQLSPTLSLLSRSHSLIRPPEERRDLLSPAFDSSWNNMLTATVSTGLSTTNTAWYMKHEMQCATNMLLFPSLGNHVAYN